MASDICLNELIEDNNTLLTLDRELAHIEREIDLADDDAEELVKRRNALRTRRNKLSTSVDERSIGLTSREQGRLVVLMRQKSSRI